MIKKCLGCGVTLQDTDDSALGYTPKLSNDLCMRCFKLKHYGENLNNSKVQDNASIINYINKTKATVLFLVDFLNINNEIIEYFKKIKNSKYLVITKSDIIPKNILKDKLVENIKRVYSINEDIYFSSTLSKENINKFLSLANDTKVMLCGLTNMGKSSLINKMIGSDITVSNKENTTQEFIKVGSFIDAPGFVSNYKVLVAASKIKPITYQLKSKYYLLIGKYFLASDKDINITLYLPNNISVEKRRKREEYNYNLNINNNEDLVIKGLGFIKFSSEAKVFINDSNIEIRPSIVGGNNEN